MQQKVQIVLINRPLTSLFLLQVNPLRGSFWQNITGSVESTDLDLIAAARRELKEESGIEPLTLCSLQWHSEFIDQWQRHIYETGFVATTDRTDLSLSSEHQAFKLLPLNTIGPEHFKYNSNYQCFCHALRWFNGQ